MYLWHYKFSVSPHFRGYKRGFLQRILGMVTVISRRERKRGPQSFAKFFWYYRVEGQRGAGVLSASDLPVVVLSFPINKAPGNPEALHLFFVDLTVRLTTIDLQLLILIIHSAHSAWHTATHWGR